jgi:phospholipid transport system substrate-binding protein
MMGCPDPRMGPEDGVGRNRWPLSDFRRNDAGGPRKVITSRSRWMLMGSRVWTLIIWLSGVALLGLAAETASPGPEATVQSLLDKVRALSQNTDKAVEARTVREISEHLDVTEISRACLQATWNTLSEAERKNFVSLFRDILEKVAYPKSAKFFKDTEISVDATKSLAGGKSEVNTQVSKPEEGLVEVNYLLSSVNGRWLIEDVELDGVSLVLNLRSQMQKILHEQSYEELKRRLREKLTS